MTISIKIPKSSNGKPAITAGTKVFNNEGSQITGITRIKIDLQVDSPVTATVDVYVGDCELDNIYALLGVDTLEAIAEMHGYELIKRK